MITENKYQTLIDSLKKHVDEIDIESVKTLSENGNKFFLIDIREESEWSNKRIPNAIYIGKGILEREIEKYANDEDEIILYSAGGFRSVIAADSLMKMGYKKVFSMIGGIKEWEEKNLPIENT